MFHRPEEGEAADLYEARMIANLNADWVQKAADAAIHSEAKRLKEAEIGEIPVPPKYKTTDFRSQDFWRLRGGL